MNTLQYDLSRQMFQKSKELVPGGVHSPVRSFRGLPLSPLFIERAEGPYLTTVDGQELIDFCMSFGPLILGHKDPEVEEVLKKAVSRGWSYGATEPYSLELADYLVTRLPFIDQIRFMNSGTEAVMTAIRLARGYTGRSKIVKFNGCYHGHSDSMLIKSGSGLAGQGEASSAGIPHGLVGDTIVIDLSHQDGLQRCFEEWGGEIAAVIMEPVPANYGLLPQEDDFLLEVRRLTRENGALFIMDEVITGFRLGFTGVSGSLNLEPDLVTYGKVIGGGLPVGAVAGKKDIMEHLSPVGKVYQAGTLSANPLAMVAGLATLKKLTPDFYVRLSQNADNIYKILGRYLEESSERLGLGASLSLVHQGSLFWPLVKTAEAFPPRRVQDISPLQTEIFNRVFMDLLEKGVYLAPNAFEVGFVSISHDQNLQAELEKRLWPN